MAAVLHIFIGRAVQKAAHFTANTAPQLGPKAGQHQHCHHNAHHGLHGQRNAHQAGACAGRRVALHPRIIMPVERKAVVKPHPNGPQAAKQAQQQACRIPLAVAAPGCKRLHLCENAHRKAHGPQGQVQLQKARHTAAVQAVVRPQKKRRPVEAAFSRGGQLFKFAHIIGVRPGRFHRPWRPAWRIAAINGLLPALRRARRGGGGRLLPALRRSRRGSGGRLLPALRRSRRGGAGRLLPAWPGGT